MNEIRGRPKIADVEIEEIGQIVDFQGLEQYVEHSGFDSLKDWIYAILTYSANPHGYMGGWLYKVMIVGSK